MTGLDERLAAAAFAAAVREPIIERLKPLVRCLATETQGNPVEAWGSAVSVEIHGVPLLLTAKHVLDRLDGRTLLLEAPTDFHAIDLTAPVSREAWDLACIRLPDSAKAWGIPFVDLSAQESPSLLQDDIEVFAGFGFPVRYTQPNPGRERLELKVINYWSFAAPELHDSLGWSPIDRLITRFARTRAYRNGRLEAMRLPHGMSGGPIWRFWGPDDQPPTLDRCALAGILLEYREGKAGCLIAAPIHRALDLAAVAAA